MISHRPTHPPPEIPRPALSSSLSLFLLRAPCYPLNQSTLSNSSNTILQPIPSLKTWTWPSFNILILTNLQTRSEPNPFHGRYATRTFTLYFPFPTIYIQQCADRKSVYNECPRTINALVSLLQTRWPWLNTSKTRRLKKSILSWQRYGGWCGWWWWWWWWMWGRGPLLSTRCVSYAPW